ncbi:MAG: LacI family DNA-binding transcriptional regulator [Spirochaetia bacterium]|jgi:DNA-binding LacI/PurR family transcriptional regulator
MAVTMNEIAKQLNISIATVSRALSGKSDAVSEETRKAIFEFVEKHGYLKRKSVGTNVAFVIDKYSFDLSSQFYARIISGIEEELIRHKYYFHFNSVDKESFDLAKINLDFSGLAGVIMVGVYHDDFVLKLRRLEVPMILIDYYIPTEDIPAVLIDNTDGILKACKHLASLGHRRVAYLSGDAVETSAHERLFGFQRAVTTYGLDRDPTLVVENCKSRIDEGFRAMAGLLRMGNPPSAVVAYNDLIAVGAMDAIKQAGLAIPEDVSIVGFDDIQLAAEVNPPLSTIHVPKKAMGMIAARNLVDIIKRRDNDPHKTLVPTSLVIRGSTAEHRS